MHNIRSIFIAKNPPGEGFDLALRKHCPSRADVEDVFGDVSGQDLPLGMVTIPPIKMVIFLGDGAFMALF